MNRVRRSSIAVILLVLLVGSIWTAAPATQAAPPSIPTVVAIRAAHHAETTPRYDRVVFELSGPMPFIDVQYVPQLIGDGSGLPVRITGNAILQLRMSPAQAHTSEGRPTVPARLKMRLPNVKEIARSGDFEAVVTYGIGVARKAEIRVITLADPTRVVIDFLHR